jgi:hypothetical protein
MFPTKKTGVICILQNKKFKCNKFIVDLKGCYWGGVTLTGKKKMPVGQSKEKKKEAESEELRPKYTFPLFILMI